MSVTETERISWGSRLGSSFKGILFGLVLFVAGFPFLFWNEGNAVRTRKALDEGEGACVSVPSNAAVDPANAQDLHQLRCVLVGGALDIGGKARRVNEFVAVEHPDGDVSVADVCGKKHSGSPNGYLCAKRH